jgi:tRNA G46 methylase TrmB
MTLPRSVYAPRLRDFAEFVFAGETSFQNSGRWRDLFRQRIGPAFAGRVVFEIGCFDAAYLCRIAAKYPATAFVGLDWKCKAIYDGAQRVASLALRNVALLRGRGQDAPRVFAQREVDEIWVFHPDPCDRDVELKNRLIAQPFLSDVHGILRDHNSTLSLKTDHRGYYQWALNLFGLPGPVSPSPAILHQYQVAMTSADYWHDPAALAHSAGRPFAGEVTLFESRFLKKRLPIYYLEIRKKDPSRLLV